MKKAAGVIIAIAAAWVFSLPAYGHVPSLESRDASPLFPFRVQGTIEKGQAVYAWLDSGSDVDVYRFVVTRKEIREKGGVHLRVRINMPACQGAPQFLPWFAVVGPGLPKPTEKIPFRLRWGYGAVVVKNVEPGQAQNYFYEQYSKKAYYITDYYEYTITRPGVWYLYYWDPYAMGGDYLALWGVYDEFSDEDMERTTKIYPDILSDAIMHSDCEWIIPPDNASAASDSCRN